jgi:hypothetical protein
MAIAVNTSFIEDKNMVVYILLIYYKHRLRYIFRSII